MEAARKDSAVHVSLSSDSIFKQPGDLAVSTPRYAGKSSLTAVEAQGFRSTSEAAFTMLSEMLLATCQRARKAGGPS